MNDTMANNSTNNSSVREEPNKRKRKIPVVLIIILCVVIVVGAAVVVYAHAKSNSSQVTVVTSSELIDAIDISELSTAEYNYNGIFEKTNEKNPDKVEFRISYNSTVKVGIDFQNITFDIDEDSKIIKVTLPETEITSAVIDESSLDYMPSNPDITLKEAISYCKQDAIAEASASEELKETAEENLFSMIEALTKPIIEPNGYTLECE